MGERKISKFKLSVARPVKKGTRALAQGWRILREPIG